MYQSPFRLSGITGSAPTRQDLQLARKRLLAELELSGTPTITIAGAELSRQDIVSLFDSLNDEAVLGFHAALFEDQLLLQFLEHGELTEQAWQDRELYHQPDFLAFASPYFAAAVRELLRRIIAGERPVTDYFALFHRPQLLLLQDAEEAFGVATRFYYKRKAVLQAFRTGLTEGGRGHYENVFDPVSMAGKLTFTGGTAISPEQLEAWSEETNIPLLNLLPESLFSTVRYDLANELNELCLVTERQDQHLDTGYAALLIAADIECDESLQEIIRGNLGLFERKLRGQQGAPVPPPPVQKPGRWGLSGVGIALFFLFRILLAARSCDSDSRYDTSSTPLQVTDIRRFAEDESHIGKDNFDSLYNAFAFNSQQAGDTGRAIVVTLDQPLHKKDDPFIPLWQLITHNLDNEPYKSKLLDIANNSQWDALALYLTDERNIHAAYVPAHQSVALNYDGNRMLRLNMLAGKDWSRRQMRFFESAIPGRDSTMRYLLQGGFRKRPEGFASVKAPGQYLLQEDDPKASHVAYRIEVSDSGSGVSYGVSSYGWVK